LFGTKKQGQKRDETVILFFCDKEDAIQQMLDKKKISNEENQGK